MKRRIIGRGLAVVFAIVVAVPLPAAASRSGAVQPRTDILQLVSQSPVVEADGDLVMRLRVTGTPSGARIHVEVHNRVPTRSDFKATIAGKVARSIGTPVEVPAIPDASGVVLVTVGTRDPQSALPADPARVRVGEGVFPVTVDLRSSTGATLDSMVTYLVRLPVGRQFGPLGVAVVLPVTGPAALRSDGTTALDSTTAQSVLSDASVLEAHPTIPLTIAAAGATVNALESSTRDELRKAATGRQLSLTTFVPLRPAEWLAAGLGSELGQQFDRGLAALRTDLAPPDETTYVGDDRLSVDTAAALRDRGVRSLVIPEGGLSPVDERLFNRTLTQPFDLAGVDNVQAAGADSALSAHSGETGDPVLDANHLLADLAVLYFDDPPDKRAAVVAFDAAQHVDPLLLDTLLGGLDPATNRILQPMTLSTMFSTTPRAGSKGETNGHGTPLTRTLTPAPTADLTAYATRLHDTEADLASYRSMVTADNPRGEAFEQRVLVSGSSGLADSDRNAYLDGVRGAIRAEVGKVQAPNRQTINFTARDGVVSLTLHNSTGYPMKIALRLQGEKLEFPGHETGSLEVTLTEETTRVPLNVRTRSSGDSPLDVILTAPDGHLAIGRSRITVRSTAFSGVGIILSFGAGLFLAVWWLRHAVATRRERRRHLKHAVRAREAPTADAL